MRPQTSRICIDERVKVTQNIIILFTLMKVYPVKITCLILGPNCKKALQYFIILALQLIKRTLGIYIAHLSCPI